jgi:hypothetical protein
MPPLAIAPFWATNPVLSVLSSILPRNTVIALVLRIKTIYIQQLEKQGLPFQQTKSLSQLIEDEEQKVTTPDAYYSKNYYYLMMKTKNHDAIEKTLAKISKEADQTNSDHLKAVCLPTRTRT